MAAAHRSEGTREASRVDRNFIGAVKPEPKPTGGFELLGPLVVRGQEHVERRALLDLPKDLARRAGAPAGRFQAAVPRFDW